MERKGLGRSATAGQVHKRRLEKLENAEQRSINNQGIKVDKYVDNLVQKYSQIRTDQVKTFNDLPLCEKTQKGLEKAKFTTPTEIQRETIGLALQGHDVLGAAKTGSGKTLAFLIPILELLWRQKIGYIDGMSALIISPTRELAYQTYNVLQKIGSFHDFSAGLVIGGKDLKTEAARISRTHIVVATPGRLKQHMEETWGFNADSLLMLILDECDRIMDMGFKETINAIFEYLPDTRQTLLFSATQTKSVSDMARIGLKSPMYVSVHEKSEQSTPSSLEQNYIEVELHEKLNVLWFFIRHHLKCKILIFMHTAKQVRYVYESFKRIRAGTTVLPLYSTMNQLRRVKVYEEFCRKQHVVLFATDLASRGLDFPAVDWVVQMDCAENSDTYLHRVGRTARYNSDGEALLFLMPSEKAEMLKQLQLKTIPINHIEVDKRKCGDITTQLAAQLTEDPELKEYAKAAFVTYLKGVYMMKNKSLFDVHKLDLDKYALSLGLVLRPRVRYLEKRVKLQKLQPEKPKSKQPKSVNVEQKSKDRLETKNSSSEQSNLSDDSSDQSDSSDDSSDQSDLSEDSDSQSEENSDNGDELLKPKQKVESSDEESETEEQIKERLKRNLMEKSKLKNRPISKKDLIQAMKKEGVKNKRITFSEDSSDLSDMDEETNVLNLEAARRRLQQQDEIDKQNYRELVKKKHQEKRWKERSLRKAEHGQEEEQEAVLGGAFDQSEGDSEYASQSGSEGEVINQSEESNSEGESETESEDDELENSDEDTPPSKKTKLAKNEKTDERFARNTLDEDEQFALKLLQGAS